LPFSFFTGPSIFETLERQLSEGCESSW
jgi:hypothetical protein